MDVVGICLILPPKVRMKREVRLCLWSNEKARRESSPSMLAAFLQGGSSLSAMSWLSSVPDHYQTAASILQAWYRGIEVVACRGPETSCLGTDLHRG
jgi:hypothetical protein